MTQLWARNGLYVNVWIGDDGALHFSGQDLNAADPFGAGEYEYELTVAADDISKLVEALGGDSEDRVIELLISNSESIIHSGEKTWLESVGVKPQFWSRVGD